MTQADEEIVLSHGEQQAVVSPWGASLRRYGMATDAREREILWGYSGGGNKLGGQGDVLIPFPGRIACGRYHFNGRTFQLDCNDKEGPNAIHGFLRSVPWAPILSGRSNVSFTVGIAPDQFRGYPFALSVTVAYALGEDGLSCSFQIQNTGSEPAPVGVGFHPYFTVGSSTVDDAEVLIPANQYLEMGPTLAPTGRVVPVERSEWDTRRWRRIGRARFNHCYIDLIRDADGACRAGVRTPETGRTIIVTMDRSFTALVVYTGDAITEAPRRALALEPMTCGADAFNHPEWGLVVLPPEQRMAGRFTIQEQLRSMG